MNCPRVLDGASYSKRIHPISCSINQTLQPLSTVRMELPQTDEIKNLDWVEMPIPDGSVEYYRVASVTTDTSNGEKSVYLEHGACVLDDNIIPETGTLNSFALTGAARANLSAILNYQSDKRWTVGAVATSESIYIEPGGMSLMTAILTMMESIPDYQVEFVQASATDWHVDIVKRPTEFFCEGRLSRNLVSCEITYTTDGLCTRVYSDFLSAITPNHVSYMESATVNEYGVHAETMSLNDNLTAAQKVNIIGTYLNVHGTPAVSISISGVELSQITGLSIDQFKLGKVCRIVIPWLNIIKNEVIIDKTYADPYNNPELVTLTLANAAPDLSLAIAAVTGGGGVGGAGGGGGGRLGSSGKGGQAAEKKRYETKFEQTDRYFRLLATDTEWRQLENGTETGIVTAYSQLTTTSSSIQAVVEDINSSGYASITAMATEIVGIVEDKEKDLKTSIKQSADKIELLVDDDKNIKGAAIILAVNGSSGSHAIISADKVDLKGYVTVENLRAGSIDTIYLEGGSITAETGSFYNIDAIGNMTAQGYYLTDGTSVVDVDMMAGIIDGVRIVSDGANGYKLQYTTWDNTSWRDAGNFSRAITSWTETKGDGKITVTAMPQNQSHDVIVSTDKYEAVNLTVVTGGPYLYFSASSAKNYDLLGDEGSKVNTTLYDSYGDPFNVNGVVLYQVPKSKNGEKLYYSGGRKYLASVGDVVHDYTVAEQTYYRKI